MVVMLLRLLTFMIVGSVVGSALHAQESPRVTLNAGGVRSLPVKAERVRIVVPLVANALTTDEAIELIRERKETARQRVLTLNAIEDSLHFGSVAVEDSQPASGTNLTAIRMINGLGNNGVDVDELPVVITVRTDMIVDWRLPEADEEAVLSFVEQIVAQLKDPDITGKDERPEFSPKVEEALKAIRSQSTQYTYSSNRVNPDAIRYIFVSKLSEPLMQEAIKGAFDDAQRQVTAMANAAGLTSSTLVSINHSQSQRWSGQSIATTMGNRARPDMLIPHDDEVGAVFFGDLKYVAQVQLHYSLAP
jgi:hypothetical protein